MKKALLLMALAITAFTSCNDDDATPAPAQTLQEALETRAATLGYDSSEKYLQAVAQQCASGEHGNCHEQADGTHTACTDCDHEGTHHNGSHHNGTSHDAGHHSNHEVCHHSGCGHH